MDEKGRRRRSKKKINKKKPNRRQSFVGLNYLSLDIKTAACVRARVRAPPASGHQKIRPEVKLKILVMQAYLGASQLVSLCWLARTVSLTLSTQQPGNLNRLTLFVEFNFQKSAKTLFFFFHFFHDKKITSQEH